MQETVEMTACTVKTLSGWEFLEHPTVTTGIWFPPRAPFDHILAMVWSGARGNITITAL